MGGLPEGEGTSTRWHSYETEKEAETARRHILAGIQRIRQAAEALTWAEAIDNYCVARAEEWLFDLYVAAVAICGPVAVYTSLTDTPLPPTRPGSAVMV